MQSELVSKLIFFSLFPEHESNLRVDSFTKLTSKEERKLRSLLIDQRLSPIFIDSIIKNNLLDLFSSKFLKEINGHGKILQLYTFQTLNVLKEIADHFNESKQEYTVLKGPYLSLFCYNDLSLRPLRDLDILIPEEDIYLASRSLMSLGFRFKDYASEVDLEEIIKLRVNKSHQLPVFFRDGVSVELHIRATKPKHFIRCPLSKDLMERSERKEVFNSRINFPSVEDNFIHLCEHSLLHHNLNNGSLILSDIFFLLQSKVLDGDYIISKVQKKSLDKVLRVLLNILASKTNAFSKNEILFNHFIEENDAQIKKLIYISEELILSSATESYALRESKEGIIQSNFLSFKYFLTIFKGLKVDRSLYIQRGVKQNKLNLVLLFFYNLKIKISNNLRVISLLVFMRKTIKKKLLYKNELNFWILED